jgi:hypothetical protein
MIGRNIAEGLMLQSCKVMMLAGENLGKQGALAARIWAKCGEMTASNYFNRFLQVGVGRNLVVCGKSRNFVT